MKHYKIQKRLLGKSLWTDLSPNPPKFATLIGARKSKALLEETADAYDYRLLEVSAPEAFGNGMKTSTRFVS
jgi:hypothetical protein